MKLTFLVRYFLSWISCWKAFGRDTALSMDCVNPRPFSMEETCLESDHIRFHSWSGKPCTDDRSKHINATWNGLSKIRWIWNRISWNEFLNLKFMPFFYILENYTSCQNAFGRIVLTYSPMHFGVHRTFLKPLAGRQGKNRERESAVSF